MTDAILTSVERLVWWTSICSIRVIFVDCVSSALHFLGWSFARSFINYSSWEERRISLRVVQSWMNELHIILVKEMHDFQLVSTSFFAESRKSGNVAILSVKNISLFILKRSHGKLLLFSDKHFSCKQKTIRFQVFFHYQIDYRMGQQPLFYSIKIILFSLSHTSHISWWFESHRPVQHILHCHLSLTVYEYLLMKYHWRPSLQ